MRKVCKSCKVFVKGDECPICKNKDFTESWKGRIFIQDANKSEVAKKIGANVKGEYAIKVR
ncbi:DNA-directed RNA polymerase subunit E'' [Candidatus Woesearchaeota archaeon]|nr:DNA-directed RNA polymerase subunit E'' [Candidatus Woesearchaeota archaeon]